jgi:hypothetical protein
MGLQAQEEREDVFRKITNALRDATHDTAVNCKQHPSGLQNWFFHIETAWLGQYKRNRSGGRRKTDTSRFAKQGESVK